MLGTEVVWHPGIQNVIFCVYTTNNGFYLLSTDWFTTRALSTAVRSLTITWLLTSIYFYFTVARICYQRTEARTNRKMKEKCWEDAESESWRLWPTLSIYNKKLAWGIHVLCLWDQLLSIPMTKLWLKLIKYEIRWK